MRFLVAVLSFIACAACGTQEGRHISDEPAALAATSGASSKPKPVFHSRGGWKSQISLQLSQVAPERIVEGLIASIASWNNAIGRDVILYKGRVNAERTGSLYDSLDDDSTIVYYEKSWIATTAKPQTTLATTIWENNANNSELISRGDVILNAETYIFQDSTRPVSEAGRTSDIVDSETVLVHELGHLLGLDHVLISDDAESVMHTHTYIGANMYKRKLSQGDQNNILTIYANR